LEACVEAVDAGVVGDDHAVGSALLKLAQEQRLAYLVGVAGNGVPLAVALQDVGAKKNFDFCLHTYIFSVSR